MRLTVRYPVHFGADPPSCDRHKDAILSYPHRVDVPEVSPAETALAFVGDYIREHRVLSYGGRLYRRVGATADQESLPSLVNAFECGQDRNLPLMPFAAENSRNDRPLGMGIWNRLAHRLYVEGGGRTREEYAWPPTPFNNTASMRWTRDGYLFEKHVPRAGQIDEAEFASSQAEIAAEAEKLLAVGSDLYVETPPIAWCVHVCQYVIHVGVEVTLAHLPEWLDADLDRQYFPLASRHEAMEYARVLDGMIKSRYHNGIVTTDATFDGGGADTAALDFDADEYSANRTVLLLGADIEKGFRSHPDTLDLVSEDDLQDIREVSGAATSLGPSISGWRDMREHADTVIDNWRATGRKKAWVNLPSVRSAFGEMVCERTLKMAADMPISLDIETARTRGMRA